MRPARLAAAALLLAGPLVPLAAETAAAAAPAAPAAREPRRAWHVTPGPDGLACRLEIGANDLVAQDADLIVPAGVVVEVASAMRGSVVVRRGARVQKAVAAGGHVVVEDGAVVEGEAVALAGDVRVEGGGRVGGDAVALGGRVLVRDRGQVRGDVTAVSLELGDFNLARAILDGLAGQGPCQVRRERTAGR